MRSNCETRPVEIDGAQEAIGAQCLDLDLKKNDEHLLFPPIALNDEEVVVALRFPFNFPVPLILHLLEIIRADFMLYLYTYKSISRVYGPLVEWILCERSVMTGGMISDYWL